ncbi:MAG TPA: glycosyltransferase family 39 protein [Solirubrobacteraceae bacterium]|nr:glycosyltransferase family 39 protein [Solirubrobacteraceae bacterium]
MMRLAVSGSPGRASTSAPPTATATQVASRQEPPRSRGLLMRVRGLLARSPRAAWMCAAVACLNATCWALIVPPFQVTDEVDHFEYVQQLMETGRLPSPRAKDVVSPEERSALRGLRFFHVRFQPQNDSIASVAQQRRLERELARPLSRRSNGGAGTATAEPPLYYALQGIPYALGSSGTILERLALMRMLSALLAGLTTLFVYLFLRELLPRVRWSWTVGALGVGLSPILGANSSGVNPDALLFVMSAALFYCLARAFRRGLTSAAAAAIGAVVAFGCLTKLSFFSLVPGASVGLLIIALRGERSAWRLLGLTAATAAAPIGLFTLLHTGTGSGIGAIASGAADSTSGHGSALGELSYTWQLYLPRLPGMTNYFPGIFTPRQLWLNALIGFYGWIDTVFPDGVYGLALIPIAAVALLCLRTLIGSRTALRRRVPELLAYLLMAVGVMAMVGGASYTFFLGHLGPWDQIRYLLPLLAPLAAVLALASGGLGTHLRPAVGTLILVLVLAHDLFSQLLVISRYYG